MNYLLREADTPFFCWLGSDDFVGPQFHRACVEALAAAPWATLCFGQIDEWIEGHDQPFARFRGSQRAHLGVHSTWWGSNRRWPDPGVYGVFRRSEGMSVGGLPDCPGSDIAFVRALATRGAFLQIQEVTYNYVGEFEWKSQLRSNTDTQGSGDSGGEVAWPASKLTCCTLKVAWHAPQPLIVRLSLVTSALWAEVLRLGGRLAVAVIGLIPSFRNSDRQRMRCYKIFIAGPKPKIIDEPVFLRRVVVPVLRWRTSDSPKLDRPERNLSGA